MELEYLHPYHSDSELKIRISLISTMGDPESHTSFYLFFLDWFVAEKYCFGSTYSDLVPMAVKNQLFELWRWYWSMKEVSECIWYSHMPMFVTFEIMCVCGVYVCVCICVCVSSKWANKRRMHASIDRKSKCDVKESENNCNSSKWNSGGQYLSIV